MYSEAAGMRQELEEQVWSHFENVVAPEVMTYQQHDPDHHEHASNQSKVLFTYCQSSINAV